MQGGVCSWLGGGGGGEDGGRLFVEGLGFVCILILGLVLCRICCLSIWLSLCMCLSVFIVNVWIYVDYHLFVCLCM